jgi:hypothetical protein
MDAFFNELKSNHVSNIVFLNLLLYHTRLKQSSLCRSSSPPINGEITANQHNKTLSQKIKISDFQFSFQNSFLLLLLKRAFISTFFNIIRIFIFLFGFYYIVVHMKEFYILLLVRNCKLRCMHRCMVHGNWQGLKMHNINKITALKCDKCINTGEPAAVLVFQIKIKVVEEIRPESAAVGSPGGWVSKGSKVSVVSKVSEVSEVGWNDFACMHGGEDEG